MRHRHPQSGKFQPVVFLIAFVIFIVATIVTANNKSLPPVKSSVQGEITTSSVRAHVINVYDGDTIKLSNGEKVRFIGIDTPELHNNPKLAHDVKKLGIDAETIKKMGARSYEFTRDLLADHDVRLEFDTQSRDRYGRLLAYVYLDDGTFVNEEIIRNGYAYPMRIAPNTKHAADFKALYEKAQANKRGLWSQ
ncbi:MAG: thermonuclease family protein [Candidatus Omnitrophica bacterium]|nr:thermonuclease family protein [Candidatus Omnitrophota bacterium]